jgi:CubicO group peptidase (beta-lactamase class C family)
MFAALVSEVDGKRLLSHETIENARAVRSDGRDMVFAVPTRWGAGFMLPTGPLWPSFGRAALGHIGSTGALAFADPDAELAFAFLPNKMKSVFEVPDRRAAALIDVVYGALGIPRSASSPIPKEFPCPTT